MPWFKQQQAGIYSSGAKGCIGLLVDGSCGGRAYVDEEIIITRLYVYNLLLHPGETPS
jgi:hypothetical protein